MFITRPLSFIANVVRPGTADPNEITDWSRIAEGVPGRSNKDCRKRWVNKVCGGLNKGPWSREEDQRLRNAMGVHGSKYVISKHDETKRKEAGSDV